MVMNRIFAAAAFFAIATPAQAQDAPDLEFIFEETVSLGETMMVGETARGDRRLIPITGGTFEGPDIRGEVLPMGWDWQLVRDDGCLEVKADYFLRTDDGVTINVVNTGVVCSPGEDGPSPVRTHPVFEAPLGKYEWLSKSAFVGTLETATVDGSPAVRIRFYRVK